MSAEEIRNLCLEVGYDESEMLQSVSIISAYCQQNDLRRDLGLNYDDEKALRDRIVKWKDRPKNFNTITADIPEKDLEPIRETYRELGAEICKMLPLQSLSDIDIHRLVQRVRKNYQKMKG